MAPSARVPNQRARQPGLNRCDAPEFGGPEGVWSPEELFVASVGSCLLSTFFYFVDRFQIAVESYSSTCTATLEKTVQGLRFTCIDVSITVTVSDANAAEKGAALRLKEKMEMYCPVSASLNCPVELALEISAQTDLPDVS